jgi:hypothetical protein
MYMKETTGNTDNAKARAERSIGCLADPGARKIRRQRKEVDGAIIKTHGSIPLMLCATAGHIRRDLVGFGATTPPHIAMDGIH